MNPDFMDVMKREEDAAISKTVRDTLESYKNDSMTLKTAENIFFRLIREIREG